MRIKKTPRSGVSPRRRPRPSLSTQVVLGLVLGLAAGIIVGDMAAVLHDSGTAFILLLQMTVLPYIMLSLITGLGHLRYDDITMLVRKVGSLLVGSWALAFAVILLMPLAFPVAESASFFSAALVAPPEPVNFLTLFIPANPFNALANNVVPAVVLFSMALGIALIGMDQKHGLLADLTVLNRAMTRVTQFVVRLPPPQ